MEIVVEFLQGFLLGITYTSPVLTLLLIQVFGLGVYVGKGEGWSIIDSLYYASITATTVGYGDFHPTKTASKFASILIALTGLLLTGIFVAIGLYAIEQALDLSTSGRPLS